MSTNRETQSESDAVVSLHGVRKSYFLGEQPKHAIDGITLDIPEGSYTAIMGPSGSGKSTMMNLVGLLDTPTEGTVRLNGERVTEEAERSRVRRNEVGFVFQQFNLMPRLTAVENVALPLVFQGVSRSERRARANELLERVELGDRTGHLPSELSGGQRQRVAIARALANDPSIILADEPTGNLDTETGDTIMDLFEELHDEGKTILMISHEERIAARAERIVCLVDGKVQETRTDVETDAEESVVGAVN